MISIIRGMQKKNTYTSFTEVDDIYNIPIYLY